MLETIFEKILVNSVGPYVNGIDKKNLKFGVFGGDIIIEKISLKPEAIEMLGLPITLKFSFIGKLIIKLSLTSIASKPVEVILEDVFVNFQPISKEAWKYTDEQMFVQKIGLVEDLIQNYTAMLIEKAKKANKEQAKPEEDQGMIGRLIEKIIDNIKVSVKNIHVRFENPYAEKKYAMGITLDEIDVHTTDSIGKEQFFDRSKKENKLASLHKLAILKDLGVYWTTENTELYGNYAPEQALASMRGFLENVKIRPENPNPIARKDYIISLSAQCKVIQKSKKVLGMEKPDFDVRVQVATINTHVQRPQMENVIRLLEFFNKFERFKSIEIAKRQQQIGYTNNERILQGSERFKQLFIRMHKFANKEELKGKEKVLAAFDNQQNVVEEYKTLLIGLPEEDILKIVKRIVKEAERDKQLKAFDEKKQGKKGILGGWGLWGSDKQEEMDPAKLDEAARQRREEQAKIEKELEDALGDDELAVEYKKQDADNKYILGLNFELEGANIYLSNMTPNGEEGINFYLTRLGVNVSMMTNNMKVALGLRDFGLVLRTKPMGIMDYNDTPVLRRFKHWQNIATANDILALEFEDNPTGRGDEMFVRLDLHKLEFIFRSVMVERLGKFFDVSVQDEDLKSQAAERLEQVQIKAAQRASEAAEKTTRKNVQIRLDAPMIVIPFLQNGDPNSECWTLNLGLLSVDTKKPETPEDKHYEKFLVQLKHLKFIYYPSQSFYTKKQIEKDEPNVASRLLTDDQRLAGRVFNVMDNIHINVEFDQALKEFEGILNSQSKSHMNVEVSIPQIDLKLKPEIYKNLLKTGEMLTAVNEAHMEFVEEIYKKMTVNKIKGGSVFVQEKRFGTTVWVKYECLFTKDYLYFFKSTSDYEKPAFVTSLKDAKILDSDNPQERNTFIIEGKQDKTVIKTERVEDREEWVKIIRDKMVEYMLIAMVPKSKLQVDFEQEAAKKKQAKEQAEIVNKPKDYNVIEMTAKLAIKQIKLNVYRNDIDMLFDFQTDNFSAKVHQSASLMLVALKLDAIESTDYLFNYTNPDLKMFMTSVPPGVNADETDEDLVEVNVRIIERDHPDYHKTRTAMTIGVQLGYFFVNFKPGTIQQIMGMFIPPAPPGAPVEEAKAIQAQEVVYSSDQNDMVMDVAVNMSTIGVRLVHKTTYVCLAELALTKTVLKIKMYNDWMQFTGKFDNLQLFDTTNYPDTIDSDVEYYKVKKYELFGASEGQRDLIDLSFTSYDPKHPQEAGKKDKIFAFVVVNVKSVKIDYLQQPILRILDYLTGQLLPSINTGEIPKMAKELAEQTLGAPQFMDLKVHLQSPVIMLKPRPDSREYLELRFVSIDVGSKRMQDAKRIDHPQVPFIYCERFVIKLCEMGMFKIKEGKEDVKGKKLRQPISRNFNFEMFFEMPMFIEEYKILYETPQRKLNIANKLVGNMTPMILHLRKKDYMLIMKCLNFNIAYDDANDPMFVSDYEQVLKAQSEPGIPMNMHIGIQNLSLIILEDNMIPYSMINLHLLKVDIEMFENKEMKIDVSGAELNGSFFENLNNQLKEHKLLGSLNEKNAFILNNITKDNAVDLVARQVKNYAKHIKMLYYAQKFQLVRQLRSQGPPPPRKKPLIFSMFMQPNGNKAMSIYVNQLRTFCAAGTFMKLSDFAVMDESCNPAIPQPYKNPSPIKAKFSNTIPEPPVGSMRIEIEVDDIEIAIPPTKESSKSASNAIAIRGDISMLMLDSPPLKLPEYLTQLRSTNKAAAAPQKASDQANDFNKIGHLGIKLKEFEIFVCDYRELLNADSFRRVRKRNLLLPIVLDFSRVTYMVPNKTQDDLIMCMKNNVLLEPIVVRMSYNDILLLNKSSQIQLEQLPPPEDPNKPADAPKKELEISSHYESSDDEVPTERPDHNNKINESVTVAGGLRGPKPNDKSNMSAFSVDKTPNKNQKANILSGLHEEKPPGGLSLFQNIANVPEKAALGDVIIDIPAVKNNNQAKEAPESAIVKNSAPVDKAWAANSDEFDVKSNGIKIVLINDAEGLLVPVLEFKIAEIMAGMLMIPDHMYITGKLILACSYFNSVPSQWEPIIEKFGLDFAVAMEQNPKMKIALSTSQNFKTFQINISEQMVSTLYLTMLTWQNGLEPAATKKKTQNQAFALLQSNAKSKKLEEEDIIDFVSPYTIMNQTGYPINIQSDKTKEELAQAGVSAVKLAKKIYHIQNNDSTQYKMEADIEEAQDTKNLDDFSINTNKIKVHVLHPTLNFAEIKGIDIDRPNVVVHKLQLLDDPSNKNPYVLVSDVRIIKQKKILTLTSPYRIKNHIPGQIFDITIDSQARNLQTILHPNETFALPVDYLDGQITIQDESKASITQKKLLTDFFVSQNISTELFTGSKITLVENKTLDNAKKVFKATIRPTVQLKNCCIANLCYKISSQASGTSSQAAIHTLKPQETKQELRTSLNNQIYLEMMLPGYQWSPKILIHSTNPKDVIVSEIKLTNPEGQTLLVYLLVTEESLNESKHKAKTVLFYTKTCIVNETPYDLDYFYLEKNKKVKVPTQRAGVYLTTQEFARSKTDLEAQQAGRINSNVTMTNQVDKLFISRPDTGEITKQLNIASVGSLAVELRNTTGQSSLLELGVHVTLKECDFHHKLITKVITISPRYILINKTDYKLEIKPEVIDKVLLTLEKDVRTPLHWTSWQPVGTNKIMEAKKSVTIRCLDPSQDWSWSAPFDITTMGAHNFYVYNTSKTHRKFFKATITLDSSILYISIKEEIQSELTYCIENDCSDITLQIHQNSKNPLPQNTFKIPPKQSLPWAWTFPNDPKEILAQILYPNGAIYNAPKDLKFSFYTLNKDFEVQVPAPGGAKNAKQKVQVSVRLIKHVYTIKFYHPHPTTDIKQTIFGTLIRKVIDNIVNMDVKVSLHSIGISIISSLHRHTTKKRERRELLYILLQGLEVSLEDSLQTNTSQIRLKHFSIDNNTVNNTSYPVLLASTKSRAPTDKKCFLDLLITKKNISEVAFFEAIEFFLDDTSLNVDGPFIEVILQVVDNFTRIFTADDGSEEFGPICDGLYKNTKTAMKLEDEAFYESKVAWRKPELQEFQGNLFIENLKIFPLFFNVTFQLKKANASENAFIALNILTGALGTALANLDRAPISLAGVHMTDVFDSQEGITNRIIGKYKGGATGNALKVLGSLDILGNPVGLARNVGNGVADIVRKPYQGFKKGPVQGLVGIPAGVGSLLKNTVAGVFNSFSKITGSVASGVSNLTLDDKYLEVREKIKTKKPRHIGQGLVQAGESIAQGVYGGVTGIVKRPVEGARENGFKGAAKGTYQGVTGLVLKPVAGLLDATSKTAEGIKNTATYWDKKTDEDRYRDPRPFYGKEQFYRAYRGLDAEMLKALRQRSGKEFQNVELVSSIDLFPDDKDPQSLYILGITYGPVVYWSVKKKKIIWKFMPKDVERIEIKEGELNIYLNKPASGVKNNLIHIKNPDQEENEFVYNKVLELKAYCP